MRLPVISLDESPLNPGAKPVEIFYRESGAGPALLFLHGGWGYEIYPFDHQIASFKDSFRIVIPDRSGYGRSTRIASLPADFHARAAVETLRLLDRLGIARAILWGHSDGAVISALMGLSAPERFAGLVLEAFHYYRVKPGSREFFETMMADPERLGERVSAALMRDHGEDYWQSLIRINGRAWLEIADQSSHPKQDLYEGRLSELSVPALFVHGSRDPRTEPDEMDAVRRALPGAEMRIIEGAGHSPHSESAFRDEATRAAGEFIRRLA